MSKHLQAIALALLVTPALATEPVPAGGEFSATATMRTRQGTRSMGFDVVVTNPMSIGEAQPFKRVLAEGGQQALVNAIRGAGRGRIRLGGLEYPVDLVVGERVRDGERYTVVTARTLKFVEVQEGRASINHPFTIIVFVAPSFGRGEGQIYTQAALSVDAEGHVQADQYDGQPGTLRNVRRIR